MLSRLDKQITDRANELWDNSLDIIQEIVNSHKMPFGACSCEYCRLSLLGYNLKRKLKILLSREFYGLDELGHIPTIYELQEIENQIEEINKLKNQAKKINFLS